MKKRLFIFLLVLFTAAGSLPANNGKAEASYVTAGDFIKRMLKASGIKPEEEKEAWRLAAVTAGLLKEGEFPDSEKAITRSEAAVLAERTDELLHGAKHEEALYRQILNKGRIHDLKSIPSGRRHAVVKMYAKGIMIGDFRGMFEASRDFKGKKKLTKAEAKTIVLRIKYPDKRKKLSPDGQLIRTTKLPKNAADYEYILANLPNSFYEKKFGYQKTKYYYKPVELEDYASPARIKKTMFNTKLGLSQKEVMDQYLYSWCDMVEKNIKLRFNVDYRTIDNKWISELRSTYFQYKNELDNKHRTDDIKKYVRDVKKNKVIIKAERVVVEPSTLYLHNGKVLRVYVKFKVISGPVKAVKGKEKIGTADLTRIIYSNGAYIVHFKKGVWLERYFDIEIGTANGYSDGSDYAVTFSNITSLLY